MIASMLSLAAATAISGSSHDRLSCPLALAGGSNFQLEATFDEGGLRSNLTDLIRVDGVFEPVAGVVAITSDGTRSHRWSLLHNGTIKFDVSLTEYGSTGAAILVERQQISGGRHWRRTLVGAGLCTVLRGQSDENAS